MKRFYLVLIFTAIACIGIYAQVPYFKNSTPTRASANFSAGMPFGLNGTAGARLQAFYPPGIFGSGVPASGVNMNRIYFWADTTYADTILYNSMTITLGEFSSAPSLAFAWMTGAAKQTTVVSGAVQIYARDSNWFYIDFGTNYNYDPTKYLMVDITAGSQSPFLGVWSVKSGSSNGPYLSATSAAAATPNTLGGGANLPAIGMDPFLGFNNAAMEHPIVTATCSPNQDVIVKVKNMGRNVINQVTVNWTLNGTLQSPLTLTNPIDTFGSLKNDTTFSLATISVATGPVNVVAWVSGPNSSTDPDRSNDTAYFKVGSPLSGTYNISNLGSSGFTSIGSAVQALYDFGVCGPVNFIVDTTTFFEQITISGLINGSSTSNLITFTGADRDKSIIAYGAGVVNAKHIIKLQATAYIQFRNLTLKSLNSTYGWGIHLLDTCKAIGIKGCKLDNSIHANSTTANNSAGITVSGMPTGICIPGPCATTLTAAARADSLEIDSNLFLYGYEAINITGNATTLLGRANKIRGNTILYAYQNSINLVSQSNLSVLNNYIVPRQTGAANVGIFLSAVTSTGLTGRSSISGNKIFAYSTAGISMTNCIGSDSIQKGLVTNNMIGGREQLVDANPIYITGCKNWSVSHNTLNRDIPGVAVITSSCIRMLGTTTNITLMNNIMSVTRSGIAIPVHLLAANNTDSMNFNCFYRSDTSTNNQLINIAGTGYSLANFKGAAGFNLNSSFARPSYINDTNFYLSSTCGIPTGPLLSYANRDVDGTLRPATPLAGAHQKILSNNNLAVTLLRQPVSPVVPGSTPVRVLVQNLGGNSISNFSIAYRLNNGTPVTQTVTPSVPLNTCDTLQVSFAGFTLGVNDTMVNLMVYSYQPNGVADSDPGNDTLKVKLFTPLGGTYTIGGPGANFANFNEAVFALQTAGIRSSVNFLVNPGTYNEQVSLIGPIAGMQYGRRITFDGIDTSNRILSFAGNGGLPHTMRIENVPYVTLRNLKILANGVGYGWPVHLAGGCSGTWIKACYIGINGAGATSTSSNFMGITLSGATISTGVKADSMEIDSNFIQYGYYGINLYGGTALIGTMNKIRNNQVFNAQQYSVYLVYQQTPEVTGNSIYCRGATTGVGIYAQNVTTPSTGTLLTKISGNKLANYGTAGIYLTSCTNASASLKGRVLNNAVGGLVKLAGSNSIYLTSCTNWYITHNSILHDFTTTTATTAAAIRLVGSASATTGISLFNNSVAVTGVGQALPLYTQVATNIDAMDYNLFFRNDTTNGFSEYLGANVAYSAFRGANNFNRNSLFQRPGYTGSTDLMPNPADSFSWSLNGRGVYLSYAPKDINQTQRPLTNWDGVPDIGAYEFTPTSIPPASKALPDTAVAFGTQYFSYGMDTVASITWGSTVPGYIAVRQYSGVVPYLLDASKNYMRFYTSVSNCPTGSININYHDNWIGTHTWESGIWLEQIDLGSGAWNIYSFGTTIDTVRNRIATSAFAVLPAISYFSGTNASSTTMPVSLMRFTGQRETGRVNLQWSTASEQNSGAFIIERSENGKDFIKIGKISAAGQSNRALHYSYTDLITEEVSEQPVLYYRLKIIDRDNSFSYSQVVSLEKNKVDETELPVVFPNPYSSKLYASWNKPIGAEPIQMRIFDLSGKCLLNQELLPASGTTFMELKNAELLPSGYYLLELDNGLNKFVTRLIRN